MLAETRERKRPADDSGLLRADRTMTGLRKVTSLGQLTGHGRLRAYWEGSYRPR